MRPGRHWYGDGEENSISRLRVVPQALLSLPYGLAARLHRLAYETGWMDRRNLPCAVVSVGSITVGGSGKTPLAAAIAVGLRTRGRRSALGTRGYGRVRNDGVTPVSDGRRLLGRVEQRGDEPVVLAANAPGVPVVVADDRGLAGLRAVSLYDTEVLVLDDGFQHHRVARDVEIVVLDGDSGLGNGHLLPRGPLREPHSVLGRADALVVVDGPLRPIDEQRISGWVANGRRFTAYRRVRCVTSLVGEGVESPASLKGESVGLISGLARPGGFRRTVEALGVRVVAERCFSDHHVYRPRDLMGLAAECSTWLTTEKDAVKILPSWGGAKRIRVVRTTLEFDQEPGFFAWLDGCLSQEKAVG